MAALAEAFKSSLTWGEEQGIKVIISHRTCIDFTPGDERGLHLCEGVARALKAAGIEPFHGRMVKGGANWQRAWCGVMGEEAKVAVVMFSAPFFKSEACTEELIKICETDGLSKRVIPVFVGPLNLSSDFLGSTKKERRDAAFIRAKISGNCIPPPDMGLFQDEWDANLATLISRVKELLKEA